MFGVRVVLGLGDGADGEEEGGVGGRGGELQQRHGYPYKDNGVRSCA